MQSKQPNCLRLLQQYLVSHVQIPAVLLAVVVLASKYSVGTTQHSETSTVGSSNEDAITLLQEKNWPKVLGWDLTTNMCHWVAVDCDNSSTSVVAL